MCWTSWGMKAISTLLGNCVSNGLHQMSYQKITISGRICTGKTTLFLGLQEQLGWSTFSASQFFRDYARTHNVLLEKAEEQSEQLTKEVDYRTREMLQGEGKLIAEGWMVGIMADEFPGVLRILLTCTDEVRFRRFAERDNVSLEEAEQRIRQREKNLFDALEKIYNRRDFVDPKNYNFVVDTTSPTQEQLIDTVLKKITRRYRRYGRMGR